MDLLRRLTAMVGVALMIVTFGSCGDEVGGDCDCPPNHNCRTNPDGSISCTPACGDSVCSSRERCENNVCVDNIGVLTCPSGEHQVWDFCLANYSVSTVCDPLRTCRLRCGTEAACNAECEADRSTTCTTCISTVQSCESRNNCQAGAYSECCRSEFCECFPGHPGCGNVPPCQECNDECGSDRDCASRCVQAEPACRNCLLRHRECVDTGGSNCDAIAEECGAT